MNNQVKESSTSKDKLLKDADSTNRNKHKQSLPRKLNSLISELKGSDQQLILGHEDSEKADSSKLTVSDYKGAGKIKNY